MRRLPFIALLSLPACSIYGPAPKEGPLVLGVVSVCTDIPADDGQAHEVTGTVVAIDDGSTDCTRSVTVEDADGTQHVVGWSVDDDNGVDRTPELALEVGAEVDLRVRSVLVWGDVQGLTIREGDELVVAVEEGTWGGALEADDLQLEVDYAGLRHTIEEDCETITHHGFVFLDDASAVHGDALEQRDITVRGQPLHAMGAAAIQRGPGSSCDISDQTDELSWIVWRPSL